MSAIVACVLTSPLRSWYYADDVADLSTAIIVVKVCEFFEENQRQRANIVNLAHTRLTNLVPPSSCHRLALHQI